MRTAGSRGSSNDRFRPDPDGYWRCPSGGLILLVRRMIWILAPLAAFGALKLLPLAKMFIIGLEAGLKQETSEKVAALIRVIDLIADGDPIQAADISFLAHRRTQERSGVMYICPHCKFRLDGDQA